MSTATLAYCLNCDKPATDFCLAKHDVTPPQPATVEGEGDVPPFCGSCGRNLNQPKTTDCRWCDDEPHRFHIVVNYPYQKCYYCPNDTETKAGQGELTCVTCGASLTYEHTDAQPTTPHTATPWYSVEAGGYWHVQSIPLETDNYVAQCDHEADAALIVQRVNAFEGLVAALESIRTWLIAPATDKQTLAEMRAIVNDACKLAGKGE